MSAAVATSNRDEIRVLKIKRASSSALGIVVLLDSVLGLLRLKEIAGTYAMPTTRAALVPDPQQSAAS
ncbi:hypothetical protein SUNI508_09836 [Seiridium unicorne]|uniref:Uncharacterized protein n=1 Tax=Seiridium unicorne TaxID=138068 RepID=A0ABR2UN42_9PEZI